MPLSGAVLTSIPPDEFPHDSWAISVSRHAPLFASRQHKTIKCVAGIIKRVRPRNMKITFMSDEAGREISSTSGFPYKFQPNRPTDALVPSKDRMGRK